MSENNFNNLNQGGTYSGMNYQDNSPYRNTGVNYGSPYEHTNSSYNYDSSSNRAMEAGQPVNENIQRNNISGNTSGNKSNKSKKPVRKDSMGRKIGRTAVIAAVFGLVAGGTFQGINLGVEKIRNIAVSSDEKTEESDAKESDKQSSEANDIDTQTTVSNAGSTTLKYDVASIVESVQPSIVSITTKSTVTQQYFFTSYSMPETGAGSGIIIGQDDDNIYVATNYHVIGGAEAISVGLNDGEVVDAEVKGYDEDADIAVIVMKKSNMKESTKNSIVIAQTGDSDTLQVGEPAIAIGNALGYGQSVTVGYISALNRTIEGSEGSFIQTDAAINPGNSGGALIDAKGNVIGINSVKYVDSTVEGMGFSIPINKAMSIIQDIIDGKQTGNTYLGITGATISNDYAQIYGFPEGVYVKEITPSSPAEKAELHPGDIIVAFDGDDVYTIEELQNKIRACDVGQEVKLEIYRADTLGNYNKTEITVTLEMEH